MKYLPMLNRRKSPRRKMVLSIKVSVDKTYVPAVITNGANRDPRELGVRVFHAYIQPKAS